MPQQRCPTKCNVYVVVRQLTPRVLRTPLPGFPLRVETPTHPQTTNSVVLPIRPITSVSTVPAADATGKEPQRRPSRRDSDLRYLAELPRALKGRAVRQGRIIVSSRLLPCHDKRAGLVVWLLVALVGGEEACVFFGVWWCFCFLSGSDFGGNWGTFVPGVGCGAVTGSSVLFVLSRAVPCCSSVASLGANIS